MLAVTMLSLKTKPSVVEKRSMRGPRRKRAKVSWDKGTVMTTQRDGRQSQSLE